MVQTTKLAQPVAFIAINKNLVKVYNDSDIYMKDEQVFQFYLVNPTSDSYLAKIKINDNYISSTGLIIRPGEKIWLDCNWDDNTKFLFRTYEVDDTPETKEAISKNGDVVVEFYKEKKIQPLWKSPSGNIGNLDFNPSRSNIYGGTSGDIIYCSATMDDLGTLSVDGDKSMETGRVEKGGKSDQKFTSVDMDFNLFMDTQSVYKILPESVKPITADSIRNYCGQCGKKVKPKDNFCRKCGNDVRN